jgi:hypothetical protein
MAAKRKEQANDERGRSAPNVPQAIRPVYDAIVALTDEFCGNHLNEEYAGLCREMAATLARKRPSPLLQGKPVSWACGIIRTVGFANFLDDPTQKPHMRLMDISQALGVSESTAAAKGSKIRKLLNVHRFDPAWTVPANVGKNPMIWLLEINGLPMDIRHAPREIQAIAFEKGLIPYIPADREDTRS